MVYLDYAATAPLRAEALEAMKPYLCTVFGNADSLHGYGREAANAVMRARDDIARLLGAEPSEVYFTSGGTEADNWAIRGLGSGSALVSAFEHTAVLSSLPLRAGGGASLPVSAEGAVLPLSFHEHGSALSSSEASPSCSSFPPKEEAGLVAVMAVNNETGCIQPIKSLAEAAHARGALFFSDCVQAACTQDLATIYSHADALSLSSHKVGGPKGVGALVVKKGIPLRPLLAGGEQERGMRGGTVNVAGVVGFSAALKLAQAERDDFCEHAEHLRSLFEGILLHNLKGEVVVDGEHRAPNISHLTFSKGGGWLADRLDLVGIACSAGAACSAHARKPSHVLLAMGRSEEDAEKGLRFSFGRETTEEEVRFAASELIKILR